MGFVRFHRDYHFGSFSFDEFLALTPPTETHRLQSGEYQLCDLRPMLIFFCC